MIEYRSLDRVPFELLHESFVEAFSDYIVRISLTPDQLRTMHHLRGVDYAASIGAFNGDRLVGFTFNGVGQWNGRLTAYDAGTAVLSEFRGQGITTDMFSRLTPMLLERGVRNYLLEVITENTPAFRLYEKMGFHVTRRFQCAKLTLDRLSPLEAATVPIREVPVNEWPTLRRALEADQSDSFAPSWQNSWDMAERMPELFRVVGVFDAGRCIGYGIVAPTSGSIPQIWVHHHHRRSAIGSAIVRELASWARGAGKLSWVNIDDRRPEVMSFLRHIGFEESVSQYEMERSLG